MVDVVEKGQSSNGVGKSLFAVHLQNTLFKDILTLEEQKDNI